MVRGPSVMCTASHTNVLMLESSIELQDYLREYYSNAANFYDGEILRHILLYQEENDRLNELKWWARLKSGKATSLRRTLKKNGFREVYDNLMAVTGLWPQFLIGTMRRDSILKCDNVCCTHLSDTFCWLNLTGTAKLPAQGLFRLVRYRWWRKRDYGVASRFRESRQFALIASVNGTGTDN
jgi:hypothetical protein